jgi:hypothetical protein
VLIFKRLSQVSTYLIKRGDDFKSKVDLKKLAMSEDSSTEVLAFFTLMIKIIVRSDKREDIKKVKKIA